MSLMTNLGGKAIFTGTTLLYLAMLSGCVSVQPIPTEGTVLVPATKMKTLIDGQVQAATMIMQSFNYRTIEPHYIQQVWRETDLKHLKDSEWYSNGFRCGEFSTAFMDYLNRRQVKLNEPRWAVGVLYLYGHTQICFLDTTLQLWALEPQDGRVGRIIRGVKVRAVIF